MGFARGDSMLQPPTDVCGHITAPVNFLFSGSTSRPQFSRYLRKYWTGSLTGGIPGESRMQLTPLIVMALSVGTLVSLAFTGLRSHQFLPSFIFVSVFVLGVGLLIKHFTERPQT
jgi:hypothetical protein